MRMDCHPDDSVREWIIRKGEMLLKMRRQINLDINKVITFPNAVCIRIRTYFVLLAHLVTRASVPIFCLPDRFIFIGFFMLYFPSFSIQKVISTKS